MTPSCPSRASPISKASSYRPRLEKLGYLQAAAVYQLGRLRHQIAEHPVDPVAFFLFHQIAQRRMIFHVNFGEERAVFRVFQPGWRAGGSGTARRVEGGYQAAPVRRSQQELLNPAPFF